MGTHRKEWLILSLGCQKSFAEMGEFQSIFECKERNDKNLQSFECRQGYVILICMRFIHLFTQTFTERLLCARHCYNMLGYKNEKTWFFLQGAHSSD